MVLLSQDFLDLDIEEGLSRLLEEETSIAADTPPVEAGKRCPLAGPVNSL